MYYIMVDQNWEELVLSTTLRDQFGHILLNKRFISVVNISFLRMEG